jgi:hypothetical protein
MKILSILILSSLFFSCASYQEGNDAFIVKGEHPSDTPITGYIDKPYSTTYYTLLQFTFGNNSPDWKRIKSVNLDFDNNVLNKKIKVTLGDDLGYWADSIKHKLAVDNFNTQVVLGSIAAAGAATAISGANSGNSSTVNTGSLAYATSMAVAGVNDFSSSKKSLSRAKLLPVGHLYKPFSIPAGLVTKRWLLLEVVNEEMPKIVYLDVVYNNDEKVRYKIQVRFDHL